MTTLLFSITIFFSAFLLFFVQPMTVKMLLPYLGGVPAVWNTCMVFFQLLLLAGYFYSDRLVNLCSKKAAQLSIHFCLLGLSLLFLPVYFTDALLSSNASMNPILWLFGVLLTGLGLPFFVISTNAPLLQRWFSDTDTTGAKDPYFLYVASNCGSLLALFIYPILIEPTFKLSQQSHLFMWAYWLLAFLVILCGWFSFNAKRATRVTPVSPKINSEGIPFGKKLRWLALSAIPSSLMMGLTTHIATDIASVPLIWMVPFSVYLISFILAFSKKSFLSQESLAWVFPYLVVAVVVMLCMNSTGALFFVIGINLAAFFVIALYLHRSLALERPSPSKLTEFYFLLSLGGVLGGIFNALVAPFIFEQAIEYPLVITLSCFFIHRRLSKLETKPGVLDWGLPVIVGLVTYGLIQLMTLITKTHSYNSSFDKLISFGMLGLPAFLCFVCRMRPIRFMLSIASLLFVAIFLSPVQTDIVSVKRSFFAVSMIKNVEIAGQKYRMYLHGTTVHGLQNLNPLRAKEAISYYHQGSPFGEIFRQSENNFVKKKVAVIGLGAGCMAVYAKKAEVWDFYEIDPVVRYFAVNEKYFTYLHDCLAEWEIHMGDGRLSIEKAPDRFYDLIVLDAFSSDSIPVHLVTQEAIKLYLSKLSEKGLIVFNISNRYFKMEPILGNTGNSLGLYCYYQNDNVLPAGIDSPADTPYYPSKWLVMARSKEALALIIGNKKWIATPDKIENEKIWTDDFSNIWKAIEFRK